MKVLTIKQPWASLIIEGHKKFEFRSWQTKYRGRLYIHAGKTIEKKYLEIFKDLNIECPTGCIIGYVDMVDCIKVTEEFENKLVKENSLVYGQSTGREGYAWKVDNPTKIKQINCLGKLSIWNYEEKK